jgi:hypothetical protein
METLPKEWGMELNASKTVIARYITEFLKVPVYYGRICPRLTNLQVWSAENPSGAYSVIERMVSLKSQLQTWVSRGGKYDVARAALHLAFMISGRVKRGADYSSGRRINAGYYDLPLGALYAPLGMGGCGLLFRGLEMANCDAFIGAYPRPVIEEIMKCSTGLSQDVSLSGTIARSLVKDNKMRGVEYRRNHRDESLIQSVLVAQTYLRTRGIAIPSRNYFTIPEDTVEQTIRGQKAVRRIAEAENERRIKYCSGKIDEKAWETLLAPLSTMTFTDTGEDITGVWNDFPIVGVDVFNDFRYLYPRGERGPISERIESQVRSLAARAAIDMTFNAKYIISLIVKSGTAEEAENKILMLGANLRKRSYISRMVQLIWDIKDDIEFMFATGSYSINDPICGEFRLDRADFLRFIDWHYEHGGELPGTINRLKSIALVYAAIVRPRIEGKCSKLRVTRK